MKHTPGPWIIRDKSGTVGNPAIGIEGQNGEAIAKVIYTDGFGTLETNARLIAAAPLLLDTLKSATAWIRKAGGDCSTLDAILEPFR